MIYKNKADMPKYCPPSDAFADDFYPVYRYTKKEEVEELDFKNHLKANIQL